MGTKAALLKKKMISVFFLEAQKLGRTSRTRLRELEAFR
jgi:hypothetical protein